MHTSIKVSSHLFLLTQITNHISIAANLHLKFLLYTSLIVKGNLARLFQRRHGNGFFPNLINFNDERVSNDFRFVNHHKKGFIWSPTSNYGNGFQCSLHGESMLH
jgi:hypothetical protein